MTDHLSKARRLRNLSRIRGRDTAYNNKEYGRCPSFLFGWAAFFVWIFSKKLIFRDLTLLGFPPELAARYEANWEKMRDESMVMERWQ